MNEITINEIRNAACGANDDGTAKAIVIAGLQKFNINDATEDPEVIMEVSTMDAIVDIKSIGTFSYINLKFPSADNTDLSLFYRCLEQYFEMADDEDGDHELIAFVSIVPLELAGEYMINGMYPLFWALEPDMVNDPARTLRLVHIPEDIQFIHSDLNSDELEELMAKASNGDYDYTVNGVEDYLSDEEDELRMQKEEEFEEAIEERNRSFTDDKYDPANAFNAFTLDNESEE